MRVDRGLVLACVLVTVPAATMAQDSGVSVPQPVTSVDDPQPQPVAAPAPAPAAAPAAKPSGAIPYSKGEEYGPYVPYRGAKASDADDASDAAPAKPFDPDASIVTAESMRRPLPVAAETDSSPDGRIVTHVPTSRDEINDGTLIRVRLSQTLSTLRTQPGSRFRAVVSEPVVQNGMVYIPEGSVLEGRVTLVRGGKRVGESAAIHLEPERVMLPDGTQYPIVARVIDTSSWQNTKVDREGTILRKDPVKGVVETGALTTASGAAAGAMLGGVPGALIGAGVGAGVTTIVWMRQDRQAVLPKDLGLIFSLIEPVEARPMRASSADGGE